MSHMNGSPDPFRLSLQFEVCDLARSDLKRGTCKTYSQTVTLSMNFSELPCSSHESDR